MSYEETTFDDSDSSELLLSEPRFDEESTLVSARQVVPLADVQVQESRRRVGLVIGAVIFAAILGATTAFIMYSGKTSQPPASAETTATEHPASEQVSSTEGTTEELPEATSSETFDESNSEVDEVKDPELRPEVKEPAPPQKATARAKEPSPKPEPPQDSAQPDDGYTDWQEIRRRRVEDRYEQSIEERRQERRENRREARRQRRERWRNEGGSADDLFRIREIFEGQRPRG